MKAICRLVACFALALTARADVPVVVAANPVLADIVRQVGGNTVQVEVLLPNDVSSREYEPTEETARKLGNAGLLIVNGAGYEPWLEQLVKMAKYTGPVLHATENVPLYDQADALHQPDTDEGFKNLFESTDFDPFAWHDPRNVVAYAESIAKGLAAFLPMDGLKVIDENLATFSTALLAAHQEAKDKLASIPVAKRRLASPYDAFRYFAKAYNFQLNSVPGLASGTEPRPAAMENLLRGITQLRAPAVFFEPAANLRTLERITKETGAKTVTTLITEGLGPVGSPTGTYLGMFRANVDAIAAALK